MNNKESEVNFFLPNPPTKISGDVSPYKIFIVILLKEYLRKKSDEDELEDSLDKNITPSLHYTPEYRRQFYMTLLKLTQFSDMSYKDLYNFLLTGKYRISEVHLAAFEGTISLINKLGIEMLFKLSKVMDELITDTTQSSNNTPAIHQSSVIGIYFRRILVYLEKMSFQELMELHKDTVNYYEKGIRAISLTEMNMPKENEEETLSRHKWNLKQAELFIMQQSSLLENDEARAMEPKKLQQKIDEIVRTYVPLYSKAYFLAYLNNVRIRDLPNAIEALHRSFDRIYSKQGWENPENKTHFQYSLLNLAILHTMFEQNEEAMKCLKECIMVAQESSDKVCLQLAQLWLCLLDQKNFQLSEKNIANKTEKTLVRSVSLNIQSLVKVAALSGYLPSKLFDVLVKSDILNCQHSLMNLISNCMAERAGLWNLYGHHEISSLCSQLLLNSNLKVMDRTYNGEGFCQVLCNVSLWLAMQGDFPLGSTILSRVKEKFQRYPISKNWMLVEYYINSIKSIYLEKWSEAATACDHIYHIDKNLSILQRANLNIVRGNKSVALNLLDMVLNDDEKIDTLYKVRAMVIQAFCMSDNISSESLLILNRAAILARDKYLSYEYSIINMHISFILLSMNMSEEAYRVIKSNIENILSNGGIYDKAKAIFVYNQCLVASMHTRDAKIQKVTELKEQFELAISYFTKLECWRKVKSIHMYLAKLYNDLGMIEERNHCAYKFRLIAEEHINSSNENVNIFY